MGRGEGVALRVGTAGLRLRALQPEVPVALVVEPRQLLGVLGQELALGGIGGGRAVDGQIEVGILTVTLQGDS